MPKRLFSIILFFATWMSFGQLPDFSLNVTATAQTCTGNGALEFSVSGTQPGASIEYAIYLLPDTTTPVLITTATGAANLIAGTYQVIATQSLGDELNTQSATILIADNADPLAYLLLPEHVRCGNDGEIVVNVTAGTAVSYEILSGPVTVPPQPSGIFTGLPAGQYEVRVYDDCGDALVVAVQLVQIPTDIFIEGPFFQPILPACDLVTIGIGILTPSPFEVFYPVTYEYTVYPPDDGIPVVIGSADGFADIPFYNWEPYSYDFKITDVCGNVFEWNDNEILIGTDINFDVESESCGNFFVDMLVSFFYPPYTIEFLSTPAGFDPSDFNPSHPAFSIPEISYGADDNPMPLGEYEVQVTDACGHSVIRTFEITDEAEAQISGMPEPATCLGQIGIIIDGRDITGASIIAAPDSYGNVPDDVSEFIEAEGDFYINMLPYGDYTFLITDGCGVEYVLSESIAPGPDDLLLLEEQRPGCEEGLGSLHLFAAQNPFASVVITEAPVEFSQALPYDASALIADNGGLYMNNLPPGDYNFETVDNCGTLRTETIAIEGYEVEVSTINVIANCGSFDLYLEHLSNGTAVQSFWLEKFNEEEGAWEHPITGVNDADGQPGASDAIFLYNNQLNINYGSIGQFRILKVFYTWDNGSENQIRCIEEISNFTFDSAPVVTGAYSFSCTGDTVEVVIEADGLAPLTYEITEMNGQPFNVDNGTSEVFTGLEPGSYNFRVTDACNSFVNIVFDITTLDPIAVEATDFCDGQDGSLQVQPFSFLTYQWWKSTSPDIILSTGSILEIASFDPDTDEGTYFVSITSTNPGSCIDQVLQYEVIGVPHPLAGDNNAYSLCNDGTPINLQDYRTGIFEEGGSWTDDSGSGMLNGSLLETENLAQGSYSFSYVVMNSCGITDEAQIILDLKNIPSMPVAEPVAPICEGGIIQLITETVPNATYAWEGPAGFVSALQNPTIENAGEADAGEYVLRITVNDCVSMPSTVLVSVNPLPQFEIEGNDTLCFGQTGSLVVVPGNFISENAQYQWFLDKIAIPDAISGMLEVSEPGIYGVQVVNSGCFTEYEVVVTINEDAYEVVADAGCVNEVFMLSVVNAEAISIETLLWEGPEGFTAAEANVDITGAAAGEYIVTITNSDGCLATDSVIVESTNCLIPRGVSPNGDGDNDTFDLSHLDVREIKIFNRYGLLVYDAANYVDEWHGQSDKGELPSATYYYMITLSAGKQVTGWVYLQREE